MAVLHLLPKVKRNKTGCIHLESKPPMKMRLLFFHVSYIPSNQIHVTAFPSPDCNLLALSRQSWLLARSVGERAGVNEREREKRKKWRKRE